MTESKPEPLVSHLKKLAAEVDRAALAALRRGLGKPPGTVPATYPFVVPFLPANAGPDRVRPYFVVASLFALHPHSCTGESFGRTYERLKESPSRDIRFRALLNAGPAELSGHLRQAVSLLSASQEIPVDWEMLLNHLRSWTNPRRWVQQRWARDYWTPRVTVSPDPREE